MASIFVLKRCNLWLIVCDNVNLDRATGVLLHTEAD